MRNLSLVKKLSYLKEEQEYTDEALLESVGMAFTRGTITEIAGGPSSGKTSLMLCILSKLTADGEICAIVDASDSFDPRTAVLGGVELENLLWVRCGRDIEKAFMATDHLLQAKGFGVVWLNLNGLSAGRLQLVPKTYWYRYRTRIRETPTLLLVTAPEPVTGSASHQSFLFSRSSTLWSGSGRFKLLREFQISLNSRKQFLGEPLQTKIEADHTDV